MKNSKNKIVQEKSFRLLRPPRLLPELEPPGYFGENYSDSLPLKDPEVLVDFEVYSNDSIRVIENKEYASAEKILKNHPEVKKLIEGKDYKYFGVRKLEQKRDSGTVKYILYLYVYNENYTVEIHLDKNLKQVTKVLKTREQPAPTEDETNEAIEIARHDDNVSKFITDTMVGRAILLDIVDPADKHCGKRIFDIQFGYSEKRLPVYKALVDISSKRVISSRAIEQSKK